MEKKQVVYNQEVAKKSRKKNNNTGEPLLDSTNERYVLFPVEHTDIWDFYQTSVANFWTAEEIQLKHDVTQWDNKLNENERFFISRVLAFFAASDGIVNSNLAENFINDVAYIEAKFFYGFQIAVENIHSHTYSLLIDTLVKDTAEQSKLFNAIEQIPTVKTKSKWALRWIKEGNFVEQLIAFAAVEGIFFSGSFCSIYWLKSRGLMPGLAQSNELIARDEGLHRDFACHLYREHIQDKLPESTVLNIITDAVKIEQEFVTESLPVELIGMNSNQMSDYIEFVADHLLQELGLDKHYHTKNPFDFMDMISMTGKTNFFERRVTEYAKSGVGKDAGINYSFSKDEDF